MKLLRQLLPVLPLALAQDAATENSTAAAQPISPVETATLACTDDYEACPLWAGSERQDDPTAECRDSIKATCRKSCGACDDASLAAQVAESASAAAVCEDRDPVICSNIKDDPSICLTSDLHKATCRKSCMRCDQDAILAEQANALLPQMDDFLTRLEAFESKEDGEIMQEFLDTGVCRDIYPDTCLQLTDLNYAKLGCENEQIKRLCAVTCNTCEEILQPLLEVAKESGNKELEKGSDVMDQLNEIAGKGR